jgi:Ni,Fe-hydrogenase maturation factor
MKNILVLGNEFIEEDSLAKKVAKGIDGVKFVNDSFALMEELRDEKDVVIIDVVSNIKEVSLIGIEDLASGSILSAHDFDAGMVLKLLRPDVKIIGIPMRMNEEEAREKVRVMVGNINV